MSRQTAASLAKIRKLQERYEKWLVGRTVDTSTKINGVPIKGQRIVSVKWTGNSVYGFVTCTLSDGAEIHISSMHSYKPTKKDCEKYLTPDE